MSLRYYNMAASPEPATRSTVVIARTPRVTKREIWELGAVIGVTGILLAFLLYYCIKKHFPRKNMKQQLWKDVSQKKKKQKQMMMIALRRFRLDELEKATEDFSPECLLGSGAFGNVYRGVFDGEGTLAVKRAHADSFQSVEEFRNEVELLSRVKHMNLVGLVGYCEEAEQRILVYEYVPNGSLLEYIVGRRGMTLTWRQRVNIAIGAAKGIAHLHEGVQPSIIHRDIKPSNILVGDGFEAKVSDFGLVKSGPVGDESHVSSQIKGTPGYLDPAYCSSLHLTPFSDVYSFGVILLQLVTARPAVDNLRTQSRYHIIDWARPSLERGSVEDVLDANLLMEGCNMEVMLKMGLLGLRCVVNTPRDRPTMRQVSQELEEMLYSGTPATTIVRKQPSRGRRWGSLEEEQSQSIVSMDGVGLQRFHIDIDGLMIHSASMECLDVNSISIEVDDHELRGISEEIDR